MDNKLNTFTIVFGCFILFVFTYISVTNLLPNNSTNKYYASDELGIDAKINKTVIENGKLSVIVEGQAIKGCIKSTKTTPKIKDYCWINIDNNSFSTSVYKGKKYYIWLMDKNKKISNPYEVK